ncbi:hypothetical protein [Burkholderia cepacia]|uniref:hypothetical protein n=1 Tax=Burkholderia cepacia TaxID=292 RepID=UPI00298FFB3B|nr:hypothetical protein [Burkholderia cepacia]
MSVYIDIESPSHRGGPSPRESGWIYLCSDPYNIEKTKIGSTTRSLWDRTWQTTTNIYYTLFAAFHIPSELHSEIKDIETYLRRNCAWGRMELPNGNPAEWYATSPGDVLSQIVERLPNRVLGIFNDNLELDFTSYIYLPSINPYHYRDLDIATMGRFKRLSAPAMYIEELQSGWAAWPERPNFLSELAATNVADQLLVVGPEILRQRLNYDAACREPAYGSASRRW